VRLLVTASTFPIRPDDGLPRFVYDLCEALARRCEVLALVPDALGAARQERMGSVEVHRFTYFLPRRWQSLAYGDGIAANLAASPRAWLQPLPFLVAQATATRRLVERRGIDVVNSHWILPQGLSAALARGRRPRFAHVATLHGGDAYLLRRLPFARRVARAIAGRTDAFLVASTNVRDALEAALGRPSAAVVQPMGVALARFAGEAGPPPRAVGEGGEPPGGAAERSDPVRVAAAGVPPQAAPFPEGFLLYVGRLAPIKGVAYLLRALPRVLASRPGLGLVVVGCGSDEARLRAEAERLGLRDRVRFAGRLPHAEVVRHLRACRVAVVPSVTQAGGRAEGMPAVVAEALAAGARLVATATGGIPDVVRDGENGWLCRERDPEQLAAKIALALADRSPERARRARESALALDWERVADRYCEVFMRARRLVPPPRAAAPRASA
jgi:glycosyltransferase involved in cell wall biosynthesis